MDQQKKDLLEALSGAEKVLIGIGGEWRLRDDGRDVRLRSLGDPVQKASPLHLRRQAGIPFRPAF